MEWMQNFFEVFAEYFGEEAEKPEPTKAEIDSYIEYLEREFSK